MKSIRVLLCLTACLLAGLSRAQSTPDARLDECSTVGYVNVAENLDADERAALALLSQSYPLQLVFAEESGNPLSDVDVMIEDANKARLVDAKGQGPWFFAALPPGRYFVAATSAGTTLSHTVTIDEGDTVKISFYW